MTTAPKSKLLHALPWMVAGAAAATFARALPFGLQASWDDDRFIVDNPLVHEVSFTNLNAILAGPHFQAYHPLHLLSYWLDVPCWVQAPCRCMRRAWRCG